MKFPLSFILLFSAMSLITGCSFFTSRFENLASLKNKETKSNISSTKVNYCADKTRIQYISEDEASLPFYRQLSNSIFDNKSINFIQKSVMLSLIEMSRRPDEASPYSRLQIFLKYNKQKYYYDFKPKEFNDKLQMPYLKALDFLTQKFIPGQSLNSIAKTLDIIIPNNLKVSSDFEAFLKENKNDLLKNDFLTEQFFKGDEILTRHETFERNRYQNIITQYLSQYSKNENYDFQTNGLDTYKLSKDNFKVSCNVDLSKISTLKEEIFTSEKKKSHYIGFQDGDNVFLAVSSNTLKRPFTTDKSYYIKASAGIDPLPVCEFKSDNKDITLFSSNGRSPLQHLQHLVTYEINLVDSSTALNDMLNFSRHLFLTNPDRILYESKRGRKSQLDFFLEMNFPIYHVESLGDIFGHAIFKNSIDKVNKEEQSLHIDDRNQTRLWCKQ
jgi:hypothetical protein